MAFVLRHCLTKIALDDLLSLLHVFLPQSILPSTRYMLSRLFSLCQGKVEKHFFCTHCSTNTYLGRSVSVTECPVCKACLDTDSNVGFFLVLPLGNQLKEMFENSNVSSLIDYPYNRVKKTAENIEDIYDGDAYKKVKGLSESNVSLTWNSDGASAFNSSSKSIWPLQCVINELPFHIRRLHILLTGLWFFSSKPNIHTFLKPFVEECIKLEKVGFTWFDKVSNSVKQTKVFTIIGSCDSVARALLQNIKQFNGRFGCSWCVNPGVCIQSESGGPPKRVYNSELYPGRSHSQYIDDAKFAVQNGRETRHGVKGANPLLLINSFNIIDGFVVDYMHCVLLGVTKHMCSLWFDAAATEPWYIGHKRRVIDKILLAIKPPSNITRTPRSVFSMAQWKASEWRNWLLFYSPIILHDILPVVYFSHYLLLVEGIGILNMESISLEDLNIAENYLHMFVAQFEQLYRINFMTYNIHLLQHISSSVRDWGPLWSFSNFMFENNNGFLLDLFNGTQGISIQICRTFAIFRNLPVLAMRYVDNSCTAAVEFFNRCMGKRLHSKKASRTQDDVTLLGVPKFRTLTASEKCALELVMTDIIPDQVLFYERAIIGGVMIHSEKYRRVTKRINYCVSLSDGSYALVKRFFTVNGTCFAFLLPLQNFRCVFKSPDVVYRHIFSARPPNSDHQIVLTVNNIVTKCVYFEQNLGSGNKKCFVCTFPNRWELD